MQVETCAPCHSRARPIVADPLPGSRFLDTHAPMLLQQGEYQANGRIQGEVFEWGSFAQSRMQRAGVVCADYGRMAADCAPRATPSLGATAGASTRRTTTITRKQSRRAMALPHAGIDLHGRRPAA